MKTAPVAACALFSLSANLEVLCLKCFRTEAVNRSGSADYFGFD